MRIKVNRNSRITANEDVEVVVAPEVYETVFEAEDVAELIAEVTGEDVAVDTQDESGIVEFTIGDSTYTVEPDEDDEILEATVRRNVKYDRAALKGCDKVKSARRPKAVRKIYRNK